MVIAMLLRLIREVMKITREDAAELLGVSLRTLGYWESNEHAPMGTSIGKILDGYGVNINHIKDQELKHGVKHMKELLNTMNDCVPIYGLKCFGGVLPVIQDGKCAGLRYDDGNLIGDCKSCKYVRGENETV